MIKSMLFFVAVLIVALSVRPVMAGDEREYIDQTVAETPPDVGMIVLHNFCQAEFPGTHMCSTGDIVRNGGAIPGGKPAWVHPSRVIERPESGSYDSASGVESPVGGFLSCNGWRSDGASDDGLVVTPDGSWGVLTCDGNVLPVACCGVPIPSSPFNLPRLPGPILPPTD